MKLPLIFHSRLWLVRQITNTIPTKKHLQNDDICHCYSTKRGWLPANMRVRTKSDLRKMYEVLYG